MGNALFFKGDSNGTPQTTAAKFICSLCQVRKECLKYGMSFKKSRGIWGGLTTEERHQLRLKIQERKRVQLLYEDDGGTSPTDSQSD